MKKNTCALLLPSRLRPSVPKPGDRGLCFASGFRAEIALGADSEAPQRGLALLNHVFWYGGHAHASAGSKPNR